MTPNKTTFAALTTLALSASTVLAQDKYSSGAITWDTTTNNVWATSSGGTYDQPFVSGDNAIFEGTPGTVTLGEAITATDITFTAGSSGYSIEGNTLNLAGGTITNPIANTDHTITSAITGAPDVMIEDGTTQNLGMTFAPTSGSQALGTCAVPYDNGAGDKCGLTLAGTTSGNTVDLLQFTGGQRWGKVWKKGSGTWTVGAANLGYFDIEDGVLIAAGSIDMSASTSLNLKGGELHYNNDAAITGSKGWTLSGGAVDNTSGAAIVSTTSPPQFWAGNWAFIGSGGALSNLTLDGIVTLTGTRTVTVQNAATTLTIDGAVGDSTNIYGVTKDGPGTLALTAANTYEGATTVSAGTLSLGDGTNNSSLDDGAPLEVAPGATLNLNFTSGNVDTVFALTFNGSLAATGTWGRTGHPTAANQSAQITGDGLINNLGGAAPAGTNYWDGSLVGGNGNGVSDGGSGTWDTSTLCWDVGLGARVAWPNTTADKAIFSAPAGTVTLDSDVTLNEIVIQGADNYSIGDNPEDNTLNFGGTDPKITVDEVYAAIRAGITGSPDIIHGKGFRHELYLDPDTATQTVGDIIIGTGATSNPRVYLRGTTHGNSAVSVQKTYTYTFLHKEDSGTWTVGDIDIGQVNLTAGTLIINGNCVTPWSSFNFTGGTLGGTGTLNDNITVPSGGGLTFDLSTDAASHDKLEIAGGSNTLNFAGASTLTITSSGGASPGVYTLVSGVGNITGVAPATVNLPVDWVATPSISGPDLILTVTSTGGGSSSPYDDWAATYLPDDVSNPDGNNDTDNLVNLLEFGFGTDPTSNDSVPLTPDGSGHGVPLPVMSGGGGGVTFDFLFVRRKDHGSSGSVSYTPQFSSDLTTFHDSGASPTFVADSTVDAAYEVVKVPYPAMLPDGKKARFARMKVDEVP